MITRFNPSCNGGLHIGHLYMALMNRGMVREYGGDFIIRFDDCSAALNHLGPERIDAIIDGMMADLEWLGIMPDEWVRQSALLSDVTIRLRDRYMYDPPPDEEPKIVPDIITGGAVLLYPYTPKLTAERVVMDNMAGVTHLIRGEELMTEYGLYTHFCRQFGLKEPRHIYLPRLRNGVNDISKTNGGHMLAEMRVNGCSPEEVIAKVEKACLKNPANGWVLHNLKSQPRLA